MSSPPVPAKPKNLHNFTLPSLWSTTTSNHHASRDPTASPPPASADNRPSASEPMPPPPFSSGKRKFTIKIRKPSSSTKTDEATLIEEKKAEEKKDDSKETLAKVWNFMPRRRSGNRKGGQMSLPENKLVSKADEKKDKKEKGKEKENVVFSLSLEKTEVEEDILKVVGSKAARKPKKRNKTVQKQLDEIFPGMWLATITPDRYEVKENLGKR